MPKVSIFISTYNRPWLLDKAIRSILSQTLKDWDLFVINDCSPESMTDSILSGFARVNSNINWARSGSNQGPTIPRNFAMLKSDSKYLAILDDDDEWEPNYLEKLIRELDSNPWASLAFSDALAINDIHRIVYWEADKGKPILSIIPSIMILRNSIFKELSGWDLLLKDYHAEADYFIRIGGRDNMVHIHEPLVKVFMSRSSMSKNPMESTAALMYILNKHTQLSNKVKSQYWSRIGLHSIEVGNTSYYRKAFVRAIRLCPTEKEPWVGLVLRTISLSLFNFVYGWYRKTNGYIK